MRELATAVIPTIRAAVSPIATEEYRPETIQLPFIWVRPPTVNIGPYRHADVFKGATLLVDIWDYSWQDIAATEKKLAFMENLIVLSSGDARSIRYTKETVISTPEEDACHLQITYSVQFADARVYDDGAA